MKKAILGSKLEGVRGGCSFLGLGENSSNYIGRPFGRDATIRNDTQRCNDTQRYAMYCTGTDYAKKRIVTSLPFGYNIYMLCYIKGGLRLLLKQVSFSWNV